MEQPENETKHESQLVFDDVDDSREPNATFLCDLNLLIVALSLSSVPNEDCLNLVDTEKRMEDREAHKGKANDIARLHSRKQETNDVKLKRRQTLRIQTSTKDFRHCRKM